MMSDIFPEESWMTLIWEWGKNGTWVSREVIVVNGQENIRLRRSSFDNISILFYCLNTLKSIYFSKLTFYHGFLATLKKSWLII